MASAVSVSNLKKIYPPARAGDTGVAAITGITLEVGEGDFFALLGPNGAGKTTLIGILAGLVTKTSGSAAVFSHDTVTDSSRAKTFIGLVPQEFNFNIFEKVEDIVVTQAGYYGIPRAQALARAKTVLTDLGLWDKRREAAQKLSGGMKRRLMIARALVHSPALLILDEPTAGVDVEMRRHMWAFLRSMNASGVTIILTTHYLEEAGQLARTVAIINKGTIVVNEPMQGFLERHDNKKLEDIYLDIIGRQNEPA